uniref:Uncharacterized protein n=1 Tax=uncultured Alphaproteobacteria bacterium TaxID=91750 RepID=A0A6G8F2Z1_9PROT|nr:hypothetical protein PlAlph_5050 [uncultured Alphaproteobacteria bacterium]
MDAKQAADIIKSGNVNPSDFQELYAALAGKAEFAEAFGELRKQMLEAYAKGDSLEVNQAGASARDDVLTVEQSDKKREDVVKQNHNVEPWKVQARNDILQWAAKTKTHEVPEVKASDEGLHAEFKDGTQLNFVAENHVSVKTPAEPKAQNFDVVIALAKKNKKKVKLGENMTPEFRFALIEACAKANVQISNLSLEDLDSYMKFLPKKQKELNAVDDKTAGKTDVRQVTPTAAETENDDKAADVKPVVDNGIGTVLSAVAAHAAAKEAKAETKVNAENAQPAKEEPQSAPAAVNRGHSLGHLTAEQLDLLHEKGFEVDVYSHVTDKQFAEINKVLAAVDKSAEQDEPYAVRVQHGHSLGGLSDVELEVLHNSGFEVDRFSHVDDATWAQIQKTLNKDKKQTTQKTVAEPGAKKQTEEKTAGVDAPVSKTADKKQVDTQQPEKKQETVVNSDKTALAKDKAEDKKNADKQPVGKKQQQVQKTEDKSVEHEDKGSQNKTDDKQPKGMPAAQTDNKPSVDTSDKVSGAQSTDDNQGKDKQPAQRKVVSGITFIPYGEENGDKVADKKSEKEDKKATPVNGTDKTPEKPIQQNPIADKGEEKKTPVQPKQEEKPAQEPKKKQGWLSRTWNKWKNKVKTGAIIAGTVLASFFAGRSCSGNPAENTSRDDDPSHRIENVVSAASTDGIVSTVEDVDSLSASDYDFVDAPTQWAPGMWGDANKFNNMYNLTLKHSPDGSMWNRMYNNANANAAQLGMQDGLELIYKTMRLAAWTNALNGKTCGEHGAKWASTYSGAYGDIVGPLMGVIKCGDQLDAVTAEKAKTLLSAVSNDGRLNVFTLDKVVSGSSRYNNHDANGWIIGNNRNVMVDINDECGTNSQVGFRMGGKVQQRRIVQPKPDPIIINEQPDTIRRKPDPIIINEQPDTVRRKPAPIIINEQPDTVRHKPAPVTVQPEGNVAIGSRANLSDRPGAEGVSHAASVRQNGSDTGLTGAQKKQALKMAREALKAGRIDQATYDRIVSEANGSKNGTAPVVAQRERD